MICISILKSSVNLLQKPEIYIFHETIILNGMLIISFFWLKESIIMDYNKDKNSTKFVICSNASSLVERSEKWGSCWK